VALDDEIAIRPCIDTLNGNAAGDFPGGVSIRFEC
jgi:hypothetical protein